MSSSHSESHSRPFNVISISVMMFLQFFTWGAWFVTLGQCLGTYKFENDIIGRAYESAPLAAMIAPLFLGLIADRFFSSQQVMGVLLLIGGGLMTMVPAAVEAKDPVIVWLMLGHMVCYMPTLGLGNTIAFSNLDRETFPKVRVWGTIGWIAAGLLAGFLGWTSSVNLFWMAAVSSLLLGAFCFVLPNTPPPAKGQPLDLKVLFMVDAFKLLARPAFLVFVVCSTAICIPLAYYYGVTSQYLSNAGFEQAVSSMTLGQMSEIVFMLLIPFFLRRLGVKWMILIGMGAWIARYALFAAGAPDQVAWMLFLGIALHGVCYDFFFVTGFMYTDQTAPASARGQAQSMLVFFTQGVGMFFGFRVAFQRQGETVTQYGALNDAITAARDSEPLPFVEQLGKMFSVNMPEQVAGGKLLSETMSQWQDFWTVPAYMATAIAVVFFLAFWDAPEQESSKPK